MGFDDAFLARMAPALERAFDAMAALEAGAIANPDEDRLVGHYWLRAPELAPTPALAARDPRHAGAGEGLRGRRARGRVKPPRAPRFTQLLSIGIGGSALGPMFVADALGRGAATA